MASEAKGSQVVDRSRSEALEAAIGRYDPEVHGPVTNLRGFGPPIDAGADRSLVAGQTRGHDAAPVQPGESRDVAISAAAPSMTKEQLSDPAAMTFPPPPMLPVSVAVEAGDVLVLDPDRPGALRPGTSLADPAVAGIATGRGTHEAPVAFR